jgi:hypothetical protein
MLNTFNYAGKGAVITNCVFRDNLARTSDGGGLHIYGWQANDIRIQSCLIAGNQATNVNTATDGGGAYLDGGGYMSHCTVISNYSGGPGGGVALKRSQVANNCAIPAVRNCLVTYNDSDGTTDGAGGIYMYTTSSVASCTVADNTTAGNAGGILLRRGASVSNTVAYFNTGGDGRNCTAASSPYKFDYNCTTPLTSLSGTGNLEADPAFQNRTAGDYRPSVGSPCIDEGGQQAWMLTGLDLDGEARIQNQEVDMGAYETFEPIGTTIIVQ